MDAILIAQMSPAAWIGLGAVGFTVITTLGSFLFAGGRFANRVATRVEVTTAKLNGCIRELSHDIRDLGKTIEKIEGRQWEQAERIAVLEAHANHPPTHPGA